MTDEEDLLKGKIIIRMSIEYPTDEGPGEIIQSMSVLDPKGVLLAYPDLVGYHAEQVMKSVLEHYRDRRE